jgi:hypothetical protein
MDDLAIMRNNSLRYLPFTAFVFILIRLAAHLSGPSVVCAVSREGNHLTLPTYGTTFESHKPKVNSDP